MSATLGSYPAPGGVTIEVSVQPITEDGATKAVVFVDVTPPDAMVAAGHPQVYVAYSHDFTKHGVYVNGELVWPQPEMDAKATAVFIDALVDQRVQDMIDQGRLARVADERD